MGLQSFQLPRTSLVSIYGLQTTFKHIANI